jgi:hypothetical protein
LISPPRCTADAARAMHVSSEDPAIAVSRFPQIYASTPYISRECNHEAKTLPNVLIDRLLSLLILEPSIIIVCGQATTYISSKTLCIVEQSGPGRYTSGHEQQLHWPIDFQIFAPLTAPW